MSLKGTFRDFVTTNIAAGGGAVNKVPGSAFFFRAPGGGRAPLREVPDLRGRPAGNGRPARPLLRARNPPDGRGLTAGRPAAARQSPIRLLTPGPHGLKLGADSLLPLFAA